MPGRRRSAGARCQGVLSEELVDRDGQRADAPAGGVVDRVGDGGTHTDEADLADAFDPDGVEPVGPADEAHLHVGDVGVDGIR